jgi:uncharacterized protein YqjF (DUF2071 family)
MPTGPEPTVDVARAVMAMHWDTLTFLHWPYEPAVIQQLLPPGITVQTFEGRAWVSLVPFGMRITLPHAPMAPWLSTFPETNVRTYVTAADGTEGIWFFSLDASRLAAVAFARVSYGLPYIWSTMSFTRAGDVVTYQCERRRAGRDGVHASSAVAVRIGERYRPDELGPLDHFLSARWRLYSRWHGMVLGAHARHEPWPLQRAEVLHLADDLVVADGLPRPTGDPIVHYSESVSVRVGPPYRVRPR